MQNSAAEASTHYVPPFRFGLGGVPLGNEFEVVTDEEAYATLEVAWSAGVRYYHAGDAASTGLALVETPGR